MTVYGQAVMGVSGMTFIIIGTILMGRALYLWLTRPIMPNQEAVMRSLAITIQLCGEDAYEELAKKVEPEILPVLAVEHRCYTLLRNGFGFFSIGYLLLWFSTVV